MNADDLRYEYKPSLTTFFDVLGFRQMIENRDPEFIGSVLEKLRSHAKPNELDREIFETEAIAFSDSIVRSVHLLSDANVRHPVGLLYHEIFQLAFIQACLIYEDNVFLRGAITAERLHINDGIVFGPGLVDAYELESRHAVYPRILIDDRLMTLLSEFPNLLGAMHHDYETDVDYIEAMSCLDFDGLRFVDYLSVSQDSYDDAAGFCDFLGVHCDVTAAAAQAAASVPSVLSKYHWVASYHNSVVNRIADAFFEGFETTKDAFLLDDSRIPEFAAWTHPSPTKEFS